MKKDKLVLIGLVLIAFVFGFVVWLGVSDIKPKGETVQIAVELQ